MLGKTGRLDHLRVEEPLARVMGFWSDRLETQMNRTALFQCNSSPVGVVFGLISSHPSVFALALALILAVCGKAAADKPVSKDAAIQTMKRLEQLIHSAKWQIETTAGQIKPPYTEKDYIPNKNRGFVRSYVVIEPISGRYRFDQEIIAPVSKRSGGSPQGLNEPLPSMLATRLAYSYDGKREREFKASKAGETLPAPEEPGLGEILKPAGKVYKEKVLQVGVAFFPGMFWGQPFSEYLATTRDPVSITDDERGRWLLKLKDPHDDLVHVTYDLEKGGAITAVDNYARDGKKLFRCYRLQLQQLANGFWAPKSGLNYVVSGQLCEQSRFSNIVINPELNPNLFTIHFPPGTRVADADRGGRVFTVGTGPEGDLAAIKSFIEKEGFQYDLPPATENENQSNDTSRLPPKSRSLVWRLFLSTSLLLLLIGLLLWRWPRKRKDGATTVSVIVILILSLWTRSASAQQSLPQQPTPAQDYKISQCGYNVTAFTLVYFKIECFANAVYDALEPTEKGVQFAKIKDVLSAHGLEATFRQNVTGADLEKVVKAGTLAIFPIKLKEKSQEHHYGIIAYHPKKGPLLVDAPLKASEFDTEKVTAVLREVDGLVLFVRKPKPDRQESLAVRTSLSPDSHDLGNFVARGDRQITVKLSNKGKTPVFLSGVMTPCTCMQATWKPTLLRSGEHLDVGIQIFLQHWPDNATEQRIVFSFPDGSNRSLLIKGAKSVYDPNNTLSADPPSIRIDSTVLPGDSPITKEITLSVPPKHRGKLRCESTVSWLKAHLNERDNARIKLQITPNSSLFSKGNEAEGRLKVNTEDGSLATEVKVVLYRKPFFTCSPLLVSVNRSVASSHKILILPGTQSVNNLKCVKIDADNKAIKAEVTSNADGSLAIQLIISTDISSGVHSLECLIESDRGQRAAAYLPIYVRDH
jgi:hypothetical protein